MTDQNRKIFLGVILVLTVVLFVVGFLILPDTVAVQFSSGGVTSTMAKLPALLIPSALASIFGIIYYVNKKTKYMLCSILGILIFALIFITN